MLVAWQLYKSDKQTAQGIHAQYRYVPTLYVP